MDSCNCMLAAQNLPPIQLLKVNYYVNFTYITQIVHSDANLNTSEPLKKTIITVEMCPQRVLNFSHACLIYCLEICEFNENIPDCYIMIIDMLFYGLKRHKGCPSKNVPFIHLFFVKTQRVGI
jgi:hypothetical protein